MIAYGKQSLATARRRPLNLKGGTFHKAEWMESGEVAGLAPTIFMAEQPPNCTLEPHFHTRNQFQLFVAGQGSIGPQELRPVTIHYAGAHTGYGPLVSGSEGLKYFTIRAQFETGFVPIEQAREKMIRGPKHHKEAFVGEPSSPLALAALTGVERKAIIEPEAGLAAQLVRLPPQSRSSVAQIEGSAGHFLVVLSGSARIGGTELQRWESAFVPFADGHGEVETTAVGAEVVALHIPNEAPEYAGRTIAPGGGDSR